MQATYLDAFLASAFEVLGQQARAKPHRGSPVLRRGAIHSSRELTALIALEGDLTGIVFYSMSLATASKLGCTPSPATAVDQPPPPHDVVQHTVRLIVASAVERLEALGCHITTSEPRMVFGFGAPLTTVSPVLTVPLFTQYGDMDIGMAMHPARGLHGDAPATAEAEAEAADLSPGEVAA